MTISDMIRDGEAAMMAALQRSYGQIALCALHPAGTLDRDICAFTFTLFDVPFRVRIDHLDGHKVASFAKPDATDTAGHMPALVAAAMEAAAVLRQRKAIAYDRCARQLEALTGAKKGGAA